MAGDQNFYGGGKYGLDSEGDRFLGFEDRPAISRFGMPTDPRLANQLKAVSDKLSTGVKTIEVSGVSAGEWESVPQQHLDEINRLRKLAGVDLTFHGPLVEPTGITKQGWDEADRRQAETQMWSAVQRSHKLNPDGNVVVTFHSSQSLPEPETKVFNEKENKEEISEFWVVDERNGQFRNVQPKENYFKDIKDFDEAAIKKELKKQNEEAWTAQLQRVNYNAYTGTSILDRLFDRRYGFEAPPELEDKEKAYKLYSKYVKGQAGEEIKKLGDEKKVKEFMQEITHGDVYLREAYQEMQNIYNSAYDATKRAAEKGDKKAEGDLKKLEAYREEIAPKIEKFESDPSNLKELSEDLIHGVNVLRSIAPPKTLRPLKEFAIDKASETFANLALKSYDEFGNSSPIISIENPPAGSGLSRADEIKQLIVEARKRFVQKAVGEKNISQSEAEKQAKKLIGATWDVGHINMIRKYGYDEEDVVKETKAIAPLVKHVHLSDNFGLEHTELPMGMGNVPTKKMLNLIGEYNKKAKMIVETGGAWFRDFKVSPLSETLEAFGSPLYSMKMAPTWNQIAKTTGGYFSGYGKNPDIHHNLYGAGFSNLPVELGGQMSGTNRLSGAPLEG